MVMTKIIAKIFNEKKKHWQNIGDLKNEKINYCTVLSNWKTCKSMKKIYHILMKHILYCWS